MNAILCNSRPFINYVQLMTSCDILPKPSNCFGYIHIIMCEAYIWDCSNIKQSQLLFFFFFFEGAAILNSIICGSRWVKIALN